MSKRKNINALFKSKVEEIDPKAIVYSSDKFETNSYDMPVEVFMSIENEAMEEALQYVKDCIKSNTQVNQWRIMNIIYSKATKKQHLASFTSIASQFNIGTDLVSPYGNLLRRAYSSLISDRI